RLLRLEERIRGIPEERHRRLRIRAARRHETLPQLPEVGEVRDVGSARSRNRGVIRRLSENRIARVRIKREGLGAASEQVRNRRSPETLCIRSTHQYLFDRPPLQAGLAVGRRSEGIVIGVAGCQAQVKLPHQRKIGQYRYVEFAVNLVYVVTAPGRTSTQVRRTTRNR